LSIVIGAVDAVDPFGFFAFGFFSPPSAFGFDARGDGAYGFAVFALARGVELMAVRRRQQRTAH